MNKLFKIVILFFVYCTLCFAQDNIENSRIESKIDSIPSVKKMKKENKDDYSKLIEIIEDCNETISNNAVDAINKSNNGLSTKNITQNTNGYNLTVLILTLLILTVLILGIAFISTQINKTKDLIDQLFDEINSTNNQNKSLSAPKQMEKKDKLNSPHDDELHAKIDRILQHMENNERTETISELEPQSSAECYNFIYNAKKEGDFIVKTDDNGSGDYMIKEKGKGNFFLFLRKSLTTADTAVNSNISPFFNLINTGTSKYELLKPAELEQEGSKWKLKHKGKIEF